MNDYVDMDWHPAARIPPLMSPEQFKELVESIRARGLIDPIVLLGGKILDGRHRHRACQIAGVEPRFEYVTTAEIGSPTAYVLAKENRRHLTPAQRAAMAVAAKAAFAAEAKERQRLSGGDRKSDDYSASGSVVDESSTTDPDDNKAIVQAAHATKAGISAAKAMDKISREAPEVVDAVQAGTVKTVEDAKRVAALPAGKRAEVLHKIETGEVTTVRAAIPDDTDDVPQSAAAPPVDDVASGSPGEEFDCGSALTDALELFRVIKQRGAARDLRRAAEACEKWAAVFKEALNVRASA